MNLHSLAKVAYDLMPKCVYKITGTPDAGNEGSTLADNLDARGFYNAGAGTDVDVEGVLSGITKQTLSWVPEGQASDGFMTFSTLVDMPLQGTCEADNRRGWTFCDSDGLQYKLVSRKKRGCVYTYLLEYLCGPDCT